MEPAGYTASVGGFLEEGGIVVQEGLYARRAEMHHVLLHMLASCKPWAVLSMVL